ncbi:hypothetical protein FRB95_011810 [Tulasnella sp. JGI-2019a]|nr:hypothetical protein FRB93_000276 [Tulasnella sp. JGI-2019a]KAG9039225.1 hypothetical protein FRB95_011810 [Tulasnella sp. JGI-2019a]
MRDSPNFPINLAIQPSEPPTALRPLLGTVSPTKATDSSIIEQPQPNSSYVQDIDGFGIAGRIWEAAYLLPLYLCHIRNDMIYDPPCSLQIQVDDANSQPLTAINPRQVIVELGSGTGYVGLELARNSPARNLIILTDLPEVCPLLERNRANMMQATDQTWNGAEVQVWPLPWGSGGDAEELSLMVNRSIGNGITHIICSDLVYFPPLLPLLLRTLLHLTSPMSSTRGDQSVEVIISYKIRSLAFEIPFWIAFGAWFDFQPVLQQHQRQSFDDGAYGYDGKQESRWKRLGSSGDDGYFVFVARRRHESYDWEIPKDDEQLMCGRGDGTFESILLLGIDV